MWEYIISRAGNLSKIEDSISPIQKEKINSEFQKDIDKVANSESARAMLLDYSLF